MRREKYQTGVSPQEVKQQAEERCLSGAIVTYKSNDLAIADLKLWNVDSNLFAEGFRQLLELDFHNQRKISVKH